MITRTYRATDACGNLATLHADDHGQRHDRPDAHLPRPRSPFQCFSQVPAPNIGSVSASDNCGGPVTVTHVGDSASNGTSSCINIITRTYQGVDACGNISTCIADHHGQRHDAAVDHLPRSAVTVQCFS